MTTIGRPCAICTHPERSAIERAILSRTPYRAISRQWGMHHSSVSNHVAEHMGPALAEAGLTVAQSLLANLVYLSNEILDLLEVAKGKKSLMAAATLIGVAQKNAELVAKLTGVLDERPQVNILVHPDWLGLKAAILAALEEHPMALESVSRAIAERSG